MAMGTIGTDSRHGSILCYSLEIDRILENHDVFNQQRLFDLYNSLPIKRNKEAFVLAIIGKAILLQRMLDKGK